ncbi:MAG: hypothetical protein HY762_03370 [Planctomycetes bacterium]|nr:hypothetical protein [Planctomycetota bacterium]
MEKDYGICKECGQAIEEFEYAIAGLEFWYCAQCYYERWPVYAPGSPDPADPFRGSCVTFGDDSYEFLKEHIYEKSYLYEKDFQAVRPYNLFLQNFETLAHLVAFMEEAAKEESIIKVRQLLKKDLEDLARRRRALRTQAITVLLFILWGELAEQYGTGVNFPDGYYQLIQDLDNNKSPFIRNSDC